MDPFLANHVKGEDFKMRELLKEIDLKEIWI
jgi:hypothetical protein